MIPTVKPFFHAEQSTFARGSTKSDFLSVVVAAGHGCIRLQPSKDRAPANWQELAKKYNKRDYPLAVGIGSMIGSPRNWIGFKNIALMIYEELRKNSNACKQTQKSAIGSRPPYCKEPRDRH